MVAPTNPNVVQSNTGTIGVNLNRRTNIATEVQPIEFALGTTVFDQNSKCWVYVHAPTTIPSNATCTITWSTASNGSVDCSTVGAKTLQGFINGTAAFAQNDYGWVQSINRMGLSSKQI